jgi:hypothetical protein
MGLADKTLLYALDAKQPHLQGSVTAGRLTTAADAYNALILYIHTG